MAKEARTIITSRQLRMIWMRYQGESYASIALIYGITASGARATVMDGLRIIRKYGESAIPDFPMPNSKAMRKNRFIADLVQFAKGIDPDKGEPEKVFTVCITERKCAYVEVSATDNMEAIQKVKNQYNGTALPEFGEARPLEYSCCGTHYSITKQ